jgi:cobalt-zinc-cadmium efflux system outer membrane protein
MMRAMRLGIVVLGALLFASQPALAQTQPAAPPGLSLAQASDMFRRENLRLAASKLEIDVARADVIAAGVLPNPRLALGAGVRVHGTADGAERQYQIGLSQELPIWGRLSAARKAAEITVDATEREFLALTWQELHELRSAYLELQLAMARQAVLAAGLVDLERVQRVLDARAAAGANPVYDRVRLDLERSSMGARMAQAGTDLSGASAELSRAIGGPQADAYLAADALAEPSALPPDAAALVRRALERRPEIAATRLQVDAAEARVTAARKRYLPEPELGVGYSRWAALPGLPASSNGGALMVQASLPLPIFDRGQGTVDRQVELGRVARARRLEVQKGVAREVKFAFDRLQLALAAYSSYRQNALGQAESVRKIAEVTYREGRGTILELLDAYASYQRVSEQALELRGVALSAELELERTLGPQ